MNQVDQSLVKELIAQASTSPRKRAFHLFHSADDQFNRMLIAGGSGSYAAPHRHTKKFEVFTYVMGDVVVVEFHDDGSIKNAYDLRQCPYVEVPPMVWHAVLFRSEEWAFMEMALWPESYDPQDKEFAPWAPNEGTPDVVPYLSDLLRRLTV